jgi:hypothetical protein
MAVEPDAARCLLVKLRRFVEEELDADELLAPMLGRADCDGVDAYLEASAPDNLPLYARLGFEVTGHVCLPDGGPPVWALVRVAHGV